MVLNNGLACNPYLPSTENIPDGEPKRFGDRIYVFGSHDEHGATNYCTGPYVGWSAPVTDPSRWRYEGVLLEKGLDPLDPDGDRDYFAPDVAQGPDGRYYLFYSIENSFVISVAVCDTPAGSYRFLGHVRDQSGHVLGSSEGDPFQFDPAVLVDDDGRIYLYSGQGMPTDQIGGRKVLGSMVCELDADMLTAKTPQRVVTSRQENCFEDNPFFEASSIRKIDGKYVFIYSPLPNVHNLCYAVSEYPDRSFRYQGVLVSNGDLFLEKQQEPPIPKTYWGNNHGSVLELDGDYYVFYHRHTNKCAWNRQGCVERLQRGTDGRFLQSPISSLGFRKDAFPADGSYGAYIACGLKKKDPEPFRPYQFYEFTEADPYLTREDETAQQYIANLRDGSRAEYRYFAFTGRDTSLSVEIRGPGRGTLLVTTQSGQTLSELVVVPSGTWHTVSAALKAGAGTEELIFTYRGTKYIDLLCFTFGG